MPQVKAGTVFRYILAGGLVAAAVVGVLTGMSWTRTVPVLCGALIVWLGIDRRFGVAVSRTAGEVLCRYHPWREAFGYIVVALFVLAVLDLFQPQHTGLRRYLTYFMLAVTPFLIAGLVLLWRRCRLQISPSALTVGVIKPGPAPIVVRREQVESITTEMVYPGNQRIFRVPEVLIGCSGTDTAAPTTIRVGLSAGNTADTGLMLTVKPENLARALTAWKDDTAQDPALLDRVEALLRGR